MKFYNIYTGCVQFQIHTYLSSQKTAGVHWDEILQHLHRLCVVSDLLIIYQLSGPITMEKKELSFMKLMFSILINNQGPVVQN